MPAYASTQHSALNWNVAVVLEPDGFFRAIDTDTYDCDCDQDGFFCTDEVGYGRTPLDAIIDLLDQRAEG